MPSPHRFGHKSFEFEKEDFFFETLKISLSEDECTWFLRSAEKDHLPPFPVHDSCEEISQIALVFVRDVGEGNVELSGFVYKSLPFAHGEELNVFDELKVEQSSGG